MFTTPELNLMIIYNSGSRLGLVTDLGYMLGYLSDEETSLRDMTIGVIKKLQSMTDEEFSALNLDPDMLTLKGER